MTAERGVESVLSVLYVEDNASNARLVERLMARRGQVRRRAAGAADFLTKPLDITRLYACLDGAQAARRRQAMAC